MSLNIDLLNSSDFFELSDDLLCVIGPDLCFVKVNHAFMETLGYVEEELIGKKIVSFLHHDDLIAGNSALESILAGQPVRNFLNRCIHKNGVCIWLSWNGKKIKDSHFIYASAGDCSSHKENEALLKLAIEEKEMAVVDLRKSETQLSRNNADLKKFSYITSHNMRAPLANLMAIVDLLDTSKFLDPGTLELFNAFKISTRHLSETLNDLINILIIKENTSEQLSEVHFEPIFTAATHSIDTFLKDSETTIQTDFTAAPSVLFNGTYLESIFLNLITNSIKYAHPDRKPLISIQSRVKEDMVQLIYTDNGLGFDLEKVKDRIFGLYQRFHHHAQSKGIGLYLVHSQVTALGGTITIESEPGQYSRFIITFKAG